MFKEIAGGISQFFNRKELVIAVILLLIGVALYSYSYSKSYTLDTYTNNGGHNSYAAETNSLREPSVLETSGQNFVAAGPSTFDTSSDEYNAMRPVANPADLLPGDANSEWAALNPSMNAGATPDLLQAGYHIGLDTIGQSLRNANLQLRSDPIIPKSDIGPWMQSTIEPDYGRVPLEIGYGNR